MVTEVSDGLMGILAPLVGMGIEILLGDFVQFNLAWLCAS